MFSWLQISVGIVVEVQAYLIRKSSSVQVGMRVGRYSRVQIFMLVLFSYEDAAEVGMLLGVAISLAMEGGTARPFLTDLFFGQSVACGQLIRPQVHEILRSGCCL